MKHFAAAMLAPAIVLAALPTARAADTICSNTEISNSTVNGNLTVPTGSSCGLNGVTVTGNVQLQTNAALLIHNELGQGSTIDGNVFLGTGASLIATSLGLGVPNSTIGGNIAALHCASVNLSNINVGGNAQFQDCTGAGMALQTKSLAISPATTILAALQMAAT